jgi:hypothetical protein
VLSSAVVFPKAYAAVLVTILVLFSVATIGRSGPTSPSGCLTGITELQSAIRGRPASSPLRDQSKSRIMERGGTRVPRPVRVRKISPEQAFGLDLPHLRRLLGPAAERLIPVFTDAAVRYRSLERETVDPATTRQTARAHVTVAKNLQGPVEKLLRAVPAAQKLVAEAERLGYVHAPGPIGQLYSAVELEHSLGALRDAAAAVQGWAEEWQRRADPEARIKLTPGRKIGDRQTFADWIAFRLHHAGFALTTTTPGLVEDTLSIMYTAAGIELADLRRDVRAAVAHVRRHTH